MIVSSGNSQKPVTVQQIHQIKGQTAQGQQLIPHNILKASQGSTVQARVIPATVAGRPQQIHVVAAPASAAAAAAGEYFHILFKGRSFYYLPPKIQPWPFAFRRLLNNPYVNEVYLTGQNLT